MSQVVSVYSFKGGAGRSLLLAAVAVALAQRGRTVCCADFDLFSGGLHNFFGVPSINVQSTMLDVLGCLSPEDVGEVVMDVSATCGIGAHNGKVWLLPTIAEPSKLSSVFEAADHIPSVFRMILREAEDLLNPDFIFIDCPSGFSDLSSDAILNADYLICVLKPTKQDGEGIRMLLDILSTLGKSPSILLVLNQVQRKADLQSIYVTQAELSVQDFSAVVPFVQETANMNEMLVEVVRREKVTEHMEPIISRLYGVLE